MSQKKSALEKKRFNFIKTPPLTPVRLSVSLEDAEKILRATYL